MPGALADVRVLDLTHVLNGPFCSLLLAYMGADVVKVEPRDGDRYRRSWTPPDATRDGYAFMSVNSNKRGITLNLKTDRGKQILRELVVRSDVLVENFTSGVLERLGLGYDTLSELNPRLIYACSRGFGESGPYLHVRSNAAVNMAMTGWTDQVQEYSGVRNRGIVGIGDEAAGVSMALAICAALYEREQSGRGQKIEVSMQEALLGFMSSLLHGHFDGIKVSVPPMQCADGDYVIFLPGISDAQMDALAEAMEQPELAADPRFATVHDRRANVRELEGIFAAWIRDKPRKQIWNALSRAGISSGPVLDVDEVLEDEHLRAREAFVELGHPVAGPIKVVAPWFRFSQTPAAVTRPAPTLGQDNAEVYRELLGIDDSELAELRACNVI